MYFNHLHESWYNMLFLISVLTMIIGNLFALRQQNMKRFLAFSSIAQVGFILLVSLVISRRKRISYLFCIDLYFFQPCCFWCYHLVSAVTGKENIDDYKGLYKTNPCLSWVLAIALFSLAGIPPTAGFFGKFFCYWQVQAKEIIYLSLLRH